MAANANESKHSGGVRGKDKKKAKDATSRPARVFGPPKEATLIVDGKEIRMQDLRMALLSQGNPASSTSSTLSTARESKSGGGGSEGTSAASARSASTRHRTHYDPTPSREGRSHRHAFSARDRVTGTATGSDDEHARHSGRDSGSDRHRHRHRRTEECQAVVSKTPEAPLTGNLPLSQVLPCVSTDTFGGSLALNTTPCGKPCGPPCHQPSTAPPPGGLIVAAPDSMVRNTERTGAIHFYAREHTASRDCDESGFWRQSQPPITPPPGLDRPDARLGFGRLAGGGCDGWAFTQIVVPTAEEPGTSGEILVLRRSEGSGERCHGPRWGIHQRLVNPAGAEEPPQQFGYNLSHPDGSDLLLASQRYGDRAYIYRLKRGRTEKRGNHGNCPNDERHPDREAEAEAEDGEWVLEETLLLPPPPVEGAWWLIPDVLLIADGWAFVSYVPVQEDAIPSADGSVAVFKHRRRCDRRSRDAGKHARFDDGHRDAWKRVQTLTGFSTGTLNPSDLFGFSLAASPSPPSPGCRDVVVGSPWDSGHSTPPPSGPLPPSPPPSGAVYYFRLDCEGDGCRCDERDCRWRATQKVYADPLAGALGFGYRVAIEGDLTAVGDPLRDGVGGDPVARGAVALLRKVSRADIYCGGCATEWIPCGVLSDPQGFDRELLGAGDVRVDKELVVASNDVLAQYLLPALDQPASQPGRVLTWVRSSCD